MVEHVNLESRETEITEFNIYAKYERIQLIGKGAYGIVCSSLNTETNELVAIKKITNVLVNTEEALNVLRELKILRHARHENIISLKDVMVPSPNVEDIYLVFELMDRDLQSIIYSRLKLSRQLVKELIFQLLKGLDHLHSANIIHCDLKPANLLVSHDYKLKIGDFGLARTTNEVDPPTDYIVTRWYRAPELLFKCETYGTPIDIWSAGCIFAELLDRKPLFRGDDALDQIKQIIRIIGTPNADHRFDTNWETFLKAMPHAPEVKIVSSLFPKAEHSAIDLLRKMLEFNPDNRITAKQALQDPYFSDLYDPTRARSAPYPCDIDVNPDCAPYEIRDMILGEAIMNYPP